MSQLGQEEPLTRISSNGTEGDISAGHARR